MSIRRRNGDLHCYSRCILQCTAYEHEILLQDTEQHDEAIKRTIIAALSDRNCHPTTSTEDEDLIKRIKFSEQVRGPDMVICPGGCKREVYCSHACQEDDWKRGNGTVRKRAMLDLYTKLRAIV